MEEFWQYIACSLMLGKKLVFQTIWNDLEWRFWPKNLHFLEVEGKKKWSCVIACWVLNENSTQRDLTHAAWVNSRKDKTVFSFGNERNYLGKEQYSSSKHILCFYMYIFLQYLIISLFLHLKKLTWSELNESHSYVHNQQHVYDTQTVLYETTLKHILMENVNLCP